MNLSSIFPVAVAAVITCSAACSSPRAADFDADDIDSIHATPTQITGPDFIVTNEGFDIIIRKDGEEPALFKHTYRSGFPYWNSGDTLLSLLTCFHDFSNRWERDTLYYPLVNYWSDYTINHDDTVASGRYGFAYLPPLRRARNVIKDDDIDLFDPRTGLYRGVCREEYEYYRSLGFAPEELTAAYSLLNNLRHVRLMDLILASPHLYTEELAAKRERLVNAINLHFWMPEASTYGRLIYGSPAMILLEEESPLALELAVSTGVASPEMSRALFAKIDARLPEIFRRSSPYEIASLGIAAARAGNSTVAYRALRQLIKRHALINNEHTSSALRRLLFNGLAGISFSEDEITVNPMIPPQLDVVNLISLSPSYNIYIYGHGNVISTFSVDGEVQQSHNIPVDPYGNHTVTITLVGEAETPVSSKLYPTLYPTGTSSDSARLFVNNAYRGIVSASDFNPADLPTPSWYNLVPLTTQTTPLSERTHLVVSHSDTFSIAIADFARKGTKLLPQKDLGRQFAESTKWKNREITIPYDAPDDGDYLLSVSYLNGLGIINPKISACARRLKVNDTSAGLIFFPQLTPSHWSVDTPWHSFRGHTVPRQVRLHKGVNKISLEYFEIDTVFYHNHGQDILLVPDRLILTRLLNP